MCTGRFLLLVLTLGDPHSVNIEILRTLLATRLDVVQSLARTQAVLFCGSNWHWRDQERRGGHEPFRFDTVITHGAMPPCSGIHFLDLPDLATEVAAESLTPLQRGRVARAALEVAAELAPADHAPFAVLTSPIDKHACSLAGFQFPGQTEFFEHAFAGEAVMLLAGERLKVGLVTNHLALSAVPSAVTQELIVRKGLQLAQTLREVFGVSMPRIAVCGLNPHAGDKGLFGSEETEVIAPAVTALQASGLCLASGPWPADTVFYRAVQGRFDAVLAMYHDQGLGPLKTLHFDDGVNISGGLRHLRVSPDHGPAQDLFLQNRASAASFTAALTMAVSYLNR
jgi:4-hydroxythreonine-4-phosphate dehydrogenase